MKTSSLHLAYASLLLIFGMTLALSFPFSPYLFATLKALIILFVFMHAGKSHEFSKIYLILALILLGIICAGILDDVIFRPSV